MPRPDVEIQTGELFWEKKQVSYSGRRLYQYNEDDFLIVYKLFSNNKFTSNQREAFLIDNFSLFAMFMRIHDV